MTLRKPRFMLTCLLSQKPFPHFEERKRGRSENLAQLRFDGCVFAGRTRQGGFAVVFLFAASRAGAFSPYRFYTAQLLLCVAKGRAKRLSQGFPLYACACFATKNRQESEQPFRACCVASKGRSPLRHTKSVSAGQPLQRAKAQASGQGADKTIIYTENKQHKQIFMPKSLTITA